MSRATRTGFAKLGAHGLQFGFEFCLRDLGRSGFVQALADLDQALAAALRIASRTSRSIDSEVSRPAALA